MRSRRVRLGAYLTILFLILSIAPAYANIGVPMILVISPASWIALLAIVPIEAVVGMKVIKRDLWSCLKTSAAANALSSLVGVPITWSLLTLIQIVCGGGSAWGIDTTLQKILAVTVQSPWLIPYEKDMPWMIPSAAASLCIPFFFMSVWLERKICLRFFPKEESAVRRWMWYANGLSYGAIFIGLITLVVWRSVS